MMTAIAAANSAVNCSASIYRPHAELALSEECWHRLPTQLRHGSFVETFAQVANLR
jgi:hypothetical protein